MSGERQRAVIMKGFGNGTLFALQGGALGGPEAMKLYMIVELPEAEDLEDLMAHARSSRRLRPGDHARSVCAETRAMAEAPFAGI